VSRALLFAACLLLAACDREKRSFPEGPARPGARPSPIRFQENRWAVNEGQVLFGSFNCAGCHSSGGGGGMGPPLTDDDWLYGSAPQNIYATIVDGRPKGMPSFGDRLTESQVWMLVAYVRSLSGLTPKDTWSARSDHMQETRPEREPPTREPAP
jgi:cytochrome c oxidase cbb3-type subunit III